MEPVKNRARTFTTSTSSTSFQKRTCIYFCRRDGGRFCFCGRPEEHHNSEALLNKNLGVTWDAKRHIKSCKTNAYGEVEFHGCARKTRAKYIRIADHTDADKALKFLLKEWKLEFPKLLISVTGGAKTFKLPTKLKQQFRDGLFKVAQTTGAWVITGGTNTGVMKHVGEALQGAAKNSQASSFGEARRGVYCIGIATWGIVEHKKQLADHPNQVVKYFMTNSVKSEGACLDNNHTHFFLVDNGTVNKYGAEIKFRAQLEKRIMKMDVDKNRGRVPAVLLVLEGGPNTILTVYEAISEDPAIPVVVIKDSGRAADLLAFAHNVSQGEGPLYDMGDVVEHKQLLKKIEQTYPEMDQSGCLKVYSNLLKCVERKHLITIFKMEEGSADIDQAILAALLKSKSASPEEQLKLALIWNRADIARSKIFSDDLKWPLSSLEHAIKEALEKDRTEFVELLLEHGVNMGSFLTKDRLEGLYCVRSIKGKSMLKYLLGVDKCKSGAIRLCDVRDAFSRLTCLRVDCDDGTDTNVISSMDPFGASHGLMQTFERPFNELFVWAVLNNMQKMALFFWKTGEEAMAKALIACKLYLSMASYAKKRDLKDDIIESLNINGAEFQTLAVRLLDQCFLTDEKRSSKLLTYELTNWGCSTCLNLAVNSQHEIFVAHSCCQELLNDMWAGAMSFRTYHSLKTFLCMLFPPMILKLGFRSKGEIRDMPQTEEQHEEYEKEDQQELDQDNDNCVEEYEMECKGVGSISSCSEPSFAITSQKDAITIASNVTALDSLKWWQKVLEFYAAPITKFWGNVLSYLVFLGLFTYVVLGRLTSNLQNAEIVLVVFVVSLTTEELRQFLESDSSRLLKKVQDWAQSKWNLCDGIAILLFYIGFFLRLNDSTISAGRIVYSIDIMFWIIRLLDIFSVNEHLGPYVVMIGRMTIDLLYFLFIMAVFLSAYGVARQAILDPVSPTTWKSIAEVFFTPYWQTYGELFINKDHLYSDKKTYFDTTKYNTYSEPIVSLLMALYLLVANILLLNLLIAIFNNTFAEVQANSNKIWKFQRYHLIMEYSRRPSLVPPFVIINHIVSLCKNIYRICQGTRCCKTKSASSHHGTDKKMKFFPKANELSDLLQFEEECVAEYLRKRDSLYLTSKEERIRLILERVDNISQLEQSKKEMQAEKRKISQKLSRLEDKLETLSKNLLERFSTAFDRLHDNALEDGQYSRRDSNFPLSGNPEVRNKGSLQAKGNVKPLLPRRFISHNPFMHLEKYENNEFVKKAAWNFRRTSLKDDKPPKQAFIDALEGKNEQVFDKDLQCVNESTDSGLKQNPHLSEQENGHQRNRSSSCPHRFPLEDEREIANISFDETDFGKSLSFEFDLYYPMSEIQRFPVPKERINWQIDYPNYEPAEYTSPTSSLTLWADPESTKSLKFNDEDGEVDRISTYCQYDVYRGRPRNPFGRTGLTGRGLLPHWGPNHATEAVVTRWKRSPNNQKFVRGQKKLYSLEFLTVQTKDRLIIPSGIVSRKGQLPTLLSQIFCLDNEDVASSEHSLKRNFMNSGFEVFQSHDDQRNTDNAWIELKIINFHDEEGKFTEDLKINHSKLCWKEIDLETAVAVNSRDILFKITQMRNAYFDG